MKKKSVKEDYLFAGEKTPAKAVLSLISWNTNKGGKLLKKQSLNALTTKMEIDASSLESGAYYYLIELNGKIAKADKLIIVR